MIKIDNENNFLKKRKNIKIKCQVINEKNDKFLKMESIKFHEIMKIYIYNFKIKII